MLKFKINLNAGANFRRRMLENNPRILLAKVARMMYYQWQKGDTPHGGFNYLKEMRWIDGVADISENTLFCVDDGFCYGVIETKRKKNTDEPRKICIENICGYFPIRITAADEFVDAVTVIWCAPPDNSDKNKTDVIGWYKNATVYREFVDEDDRFYNVSASAEDCVLLPTDERVKRKWVLPQIKGDDANFGQSMHKFPKSSNPAVKKILDAINSYTSENWTGKFY